MKEYRDRSNKANASFYMTMISMTQSLALGYFATTLKLSHLFKPDSLVAWLLCLLSYSLVVQMIVVTWHEYSIGSICFVWPLGYADSWIPILLAFSEYFVITFSNQDNTGFTFADGRSVPCFFIALAIFAFVGWIAFFNQYRKIHAARAENREILRELKPYLRKTRILMLGNIFTYALGFFATWKSPNPWISIGVLAFGNITLISHSLRSKFAFDKVFAP